MMASTSAALGGIILLAAGLYQFTPVKRACLRYCQSPVLFLSRYWQPGATGRFRMGFRHGSYCLGCCWFLMALLFVGGVMNLVWIAASRSMSHSRSCCRAARGSAAPPAWA